MADDPSDNESIPDEIRRYFNRYEAWRGALNKHATKVGHVAISWTTLHAELSITFAHLMTWSVLAPRVNLAEDDSAQLFRALSVWGEVKNDRAQRAMLRVAAQVTLWEDADKRLLEEFDWALKEIEGQENERNNFLHAPYDFEFVGEQDVEIVPLSLVGQFRAEQLEKYENLPERLDAFRQDADALRIYVKLLRNHLPVNRALSGERPPLPQRPTLQWPVRKVSQLTEHQGKRQPG